MASHHHVSVDKNERYVLSPKAQSRLTLALVVGVVMTLLGCIINANHWFEGHHEASEYSSLSLGQVRVGGAHGAAHEGGPGAAAHDQAHGKADVAVDPTGPEHSAAANHESVGNGQHGGPSEEGGTPAEHSSEHGEGHHAYSWWQRLWANLWLDGVFFTGLAVIGVFAVAVSYVSQAGWSAGIIRVPMAFGSFLPIGGAVLLIAFLGSYATGHSLFHWTDASLYDKSSPNYDPILDGKHGYLNIPFFLIRMVGFIGLWWFLNRLMRANSLEEDNAGKTHAFWRKNHKLSAIFLVIFAVSSSMVGWDWLMSIEPHWYSTLFGWYTFASWHVSGWAVIGLTLASLKEGGYMKHVNHSVLHDVGKFMFAFSIFWTYLWIAQYLLIWYANIPEEGIYFIERVRGWDGAYTGVFFLNVILNFVFPFLFLMTRDAKRHRIFLRVAAGGLLMGHWLDFYQMVMPGTVGGHNGFGFIEFGLLTVFVSAFILVVARALASAPLTAINHPMLEESLHHDI